MSLTDPAPLGDVHITEVEGIPTVWAEVPGEFSGGITFRLGHVDETLVTHGVTHMLEHLALFGIDRPGEHSNGHVDATTLAIHGGGAPEEVAALLTRATRQLVDPPTARLEDEKGVLRAEAAGRAPWALGELVAWRWGMRAFGLEAANELGLDPLTVEAVRGWSATRIGRRNAVLWFTGPPPAGLRIDLPEGQERPAPDPFESVLPTRPVYFTSQAPNVAVHSVVRRTPAATTLASVLRTRLVDELRTERAAAYSPDVGYRPLTADAAALVAFADVVEGRADVVAERIPAVLAELCADGPTEPELAARRGELRRSMQNPAFMAAVTTTTAWDLLHGRRTQTIAEILDDADHITAADVAAVATDLRREAILQIPNGVPAPTSPCAQAPISPSRPVTEGRRFARLAGPDQLVVGHEGVTVAGSEVAVTVRHESLAALGRWDDGGRLLIGEDGVHLTVEPTLWRRGKRAVELIDSAVPDPAAVSLGSRDPGSVPRVGMVQRLWRAMTGNGPSILMIVLTLVTIAVLVATGRGEFIAPAFVVAALLAIAVLFHDSLRGS